MNDKLYNLASEYVKELSETSRIVFELYYNPNKNMVQKEISDELNILISTICRIITNINTFLASKIKNTDFLSPFIITQRNKYSELIGEYGTDKVEKIVDSYSKNKKQILDIYLNPNRKITYIDIPYIIKNNNSYKIIEEILDDIQHKLQATYADFKSQNRTILLSLMKNYGNEKVYKNINNLSELERKVITLHIGSEECPPKRIKEINEILDITCAATIVSNVTKEIEDAVKHNKTIAKKFTNNERFESLVKDYGKDTIVNSIKQINGKRKQILILYFGLENNSPISMKEIQRKLKVPNVSSCITQTLDRLERLLKKEPKKENVPKSKEKFINLIELYGKEDVMNAVNQLNDKCKTIVTLYYGLGKAYPMLQKEIDKKLKINDSRKWLYYSLKQIENFLINPKINPSKKISELSKTEKLIRERKKTFKSIVKCNDSNKINEALNKLDKNELELIYLYFGLNNIYILEKNELCDKFGISMK